MAPTRSTGQAMSFRAPGSLLSVDDLLARALPGADAAERARLVDGGDVSVEERRVRKLRTRVEPGSRLRVEGATPVAGPDWAGPCRILVPELPWRAGRLDGEAGSTEFEQVDARDGVAELRAEGGCAAVRRAFARAGYPLLGDAEHRGILVAGGLRAIAWTAPPPRGWWPDEPVLPGPGPDGRPVLKVSAATSRILSRGHPWILRDEAVGEPGRLAPGARVDVRGPDDEALGTAHVEGAGDLVARIYDRPGAKPRSVEARVAAALARREALLDAADTDAVRLVHGEADGLPGLHVDRLGPVLRLLVTSPGTSAYRGRALDAIVRGLEPVLGGEPAVVEVLHLRDRPQGRLERVRLVAGERARASGRVGVREAGVHFLVETGLDRPHRSSPGVGLYLDQRENRARLLASASGRLLNLFAHTGAFSVAWLAAGNPEAVSVDLSAPYLAWLDENLARNRLDPAGHRSVKQDGRRFLETLTRDEHFDAVVLDPPTAAGAGRRFWSVARELPALIGRALSHLAPGGTLLVCRNDRRRSDLSQMVEGAARENGVLLAGVQDAGPGPDFPSLDGFPEGDPFAGVLARRAAA